MSKILFPLCLLIENYPAWIEIPILGISIWEIFSIFHRIQLTHSPSSSILSFCALFLYWLNGALAIVRILIVAHPFPIYLRWKSSKINLQVLRVWDPSTLWNLIPSKSTHESCEQSSINSKSKKYSKNSMKINLNYICSICLQIYVGVKS